MRRSARTSWGGSTACTGSARGSATRTSTSTAAATRRACPEEIPAASRILLVADAYDAMTTDRPYRAAMTPDAALTELRTWSGYQFDPTCVGALADYLAAEGKVAA
jgi:hypothetical protein